MPHAIRLRGPWEYEELLEPSMQASKPGRAEWSEICGLNFGGRLRLLRRFGRPTGLQPSDHVMLVMQLAAQDSKAWLNRRPLGALPGSESPFRIPIHELLLPRNLLVIETGQPTPSAEVWLEIE